MAANQMKKHPLGNGGGRHNSGSNRKRRRLEDAEDEEEDFLEAEMIKKYTVTDGPTGRSHIAHYGNKYADISMFIYRMYLLNHRRSDRYGDNIVHLRNRTVIKPRLKGDLLRSGDIDQCWGRLDFGFEPDKTYVLAASRRMPGGINSRRSDAQYTFYCDNMSGLVSSPHCELMRPNHSNDFVWIKDLNSEYGTYVNGKKISPKTRYKLVEGDIVGLGIPHNCDDVRVNVKNRRFYILKVKKLSRSRGEGEGISYASPEVVDNGGPYADPMDFALSNVLILDKIMKYFKLKELKTCRLVNIFWKSRADHQLVQHAHLKFEFTYHPRYMTVSEVRWSDAFQEKVALMKKYGITSFEIDVTNNAPLSAPRQFFSDVQWLLDTLGQNMKDLILSMSVVQDKSGKKFKKIFSNLVNVENLDLSLDINTSLYPVMGSLPLCLPKLKKLALWVHDVEGDDDMRDPLKNHIISEVAKLFPNLQGINVKTGLLQNFLQYLHTNRQTWKGLSEISAEFELYGEIENPVVSFTTISTLPQTLTKLQLDDIPPLTDLGVSAFEKMLKKHSLTLVYLCLKFAESGTEDNQRVVTLPSFPRLTFLEIIIYVEDDDLHLKLQFPNGQISYEKDFPKIKTLSLLPADSISDDESDDPSPSNVEAILTTFLPEDLPTTVSTTMRWVEFSLDKEMTKKSHPKYVWYTHFLLRFNKIFPHVHHPDIIKGLQNMKTDSPG